MDGRTCLVKAKEPGLRAHCEVLRGLLGLPVPAGAALKAKRAKVQLIDEQINNADPVIFVDPVFEVSRKECRLTPVRVIDRPCHACLPRPRKV